MQINIATNYKFAMHRSLQTENIDGNIKDQVESNFNTEMLLFIRHEVGIQKTIG